MSANQIHVIRILNPFDPREHVRSKLDWSAEKTLADYFQPSALEFEHVYSVNGKIFDKNEFVSKPLKADDMVVCCPVLHGGGGGKSIFRIVAMIAIAVFAPQIAVGLNSAMGGAFGVVGGLGMNILTAGISMIGNLLVSALLPPPKPKTNGPTGASSLDSSPSYGIDGAKNTAAEGVVVPVTYGTFRTGGNIINNHVVNEGNTQILYMLINAGEGPLAGISDIELNDQPIDSFKDYEVQTRLGLETQALLNWFDDTLDPHSVAQTLTTGWTTYFTSQVVDKFRIDFVAPVGLFSVDTTTGNTNFVQVNLEVEYRITGSGGAYTPLYDSQIVSSYTEVVEWHTLPIYDSTGDITGYEVYVPDGSEESKQVTDVFGRTTGNFYVITDSNGEEITVGTITKVPVYSNVVAIRDKNRSAVRRSLTSPLLAEGLYEIRIRRTTAQSVSEYLSDQVVVTDINEIVTDDVQFNHTALLALKIRLSDQLNGIPKVTYLNHGKVLRRYNTTTNAWEAGPSSNPAWIALDILTNTRYGGGLPWSRFDQPKFIEMANHCDQFGLTFNGVFDTSMNIWDATQIVLRCGHAQMVNVGTRYTVAIEKEDTPVMMFSVANMIDGTFKQNWLGTQDRANEIEVSFFDRLDKYKQKPLRVVDEIAAAAGTPVKSTSVTLFGVVDAERAYKDGLMLLNMNRYILQTVEFGAPIEAIACTVGDLIYVQHDMPQWGYAGRFEAGSTVSDLVLDRPVTIEAGKDYIVLAMYDAVERFTGTVTSIAGSAGNYYVTLSGFTGTDNVERLVVGSTEVAVLSVFTSGLNHGVVVSDVTGITPTAAYGLWDTDAVEERDVVANIGQDQTTIELVTPLPSAPAQFQQWMFGEIGKVKKPFRVKAITGSHDYRRDIVAIEYNATVYDIDDAVVPTINYSDLTTSIENVEITEVTEELFRIGGIIRTRATVHYTTNQDEYYARSEVFLSRNGAPFESLGTDKERMSVETDDGESLTFRVVARSVLGTSVPLSNAPEITHVVVGKLAPPSDVTGFTSSKLPQQIQLQWNEVTDLDLAGYEIRVGPSWEAGVVVTTGYSGTSFPLGSLDVGSYVYHIKAIDFASSPNYSNTAASTTVTIVERAAPVVTGQIVADQVVLSWDDIIDDGFLIDHYEIRIGATWGTSAPLTTGKGTTFKGAADWLGSQTFQVAAVDIAGNVGAAGSVTVVIEVPQAPAVSVVVAGVNYVLSWTIPITTIPIEQYEIRYGASWAAGVSLGFIKSTGFSQKVDWSGSRQFWVAAYDTKGNQGTPAGTSLGITAPSAPVVSSQVVDNNVLLSWTDAQQTLPIEYYQVSRGATFAGSTVIGNINGRFSTIFEKSSGTFTYWVVGVDSAGNMGTEYGTTTNVNQPPDYVLNSDENSQLDSSGISNVVKVGGQHYALVLDDTDNQYGSVDSIPELDTGVTGLTFESCFMPSVLTGTHGLLEKTVGDNANTCATLSLNATTLSMSVKVGGVTYSATKDLTTVIDYKVGTTVFAIGRWSSADGVSLSVQGISYVATAAAGTLDQGAGKFRVGKLGTGASTYALYGKLGPQRITARRISDTEVTERYNNIVTDNTGLVAAWNFSEGEGETVNDDSDNNHNLQLFGAPAWELTILDGRYDNMAGSERLIYPISPTKTFDQLFNVGGRTTPQANIDAGYTRYCQPSEATGQYVEIIDYGVALSASLITVTLTHAALAGVVTITPKISVKTLIGDPWTDYAGVWSAYGTQFRYLKVTLDFAAVAGVNVEEGTILNFRLDVKLKNDGGTAACLSTDVGGTTVNFTVSFTDVNSITVTPSGTSPVIPTYDFADVPNPTSFKILLFDQATGARVSGNASWAAKGV